MKGRHVYVASQIRGFAEKGTSRPIAEITISELVCGRFNAMDFDIAY
jgi:hypothetical protein